MGLCEEADSVVFRYDLPRGHRLRFGGGMRVGGSRRASFVLVTHAG
jgi:hypothetical protein